MSGSARQPGESERPLLSVVIPAYNEEALLPRTLERIRGALDANRREGLTWEIVVCDNNSTDGTADVATGAGARLAFEPIRQIGRARNAGAALARGAWLLFIDADSYPPPALMAEALDLIDDGGYVGAGTTVTVEGGTLFNKLRLERLNPLFRLFHWSGGAFLLCEGEAFHRLGGFSPALFALEEIDFVIRLKRYGRRHGVRFAVLHRHPVVTSGRRGEYGALSLGVLMLSNLAAFVLFLLHYLLPRRVMAWLGSRLLGYWYGARRSKARRPGAG